MLSAVSVSAFGGVMSASLGEAEGAVVMSPFFTSVGNPLMPIPASFEGLYINVETGVTNSNPAAVPGWDLNPYGTSTLSWFDPGGGVGATVMRFPGVTTGSAGSLALGTEIGSLGSFGSGTSTFGPGAGQWDLNADNYFGFRFLDSGGQTRYGWGTMQVGATATVRSITELYFEDSGASIQVGQRTSTAPVPEPGTPLALLALGASGLVHRRVRRRA